ncbi:MAG: hypothetical protein ACLTDR_13515 [Adlercreutzia equolifaciens]
MVEPYGFFDTASRRAQHVVLGAAIFLAVVAVAALIWVSWRAGVLALATAAAMGVLGNYTMRRSPEGKRHRRPCQGLAQLDARWRLVA